MANRIILRRDTAANWNIVDPILANGEIGLETDTERFKIGNGVQPWSERSYYANALFITQGVRDLIDGALVELENAQVFLEATLDQGATQLAQVEAARDQALDAVETAGDTTDSLMYLALSTAGSDAMEYLESQIGDEASQNLVNKDFALGNNNLTGSLADFNTALTDGDFLSADGAATFTNKVFDLSYNTLIGDISQFNLALTSDTFVTQAGTQTLTGKTLTNPTINGATMTTSNITDPIVVGGTFDTPQISSPVITGKGQVQWVVKTGGQTYSSDTTFALDTHLKFTATAGATYYVEYGIGVATGHGGVVCQLNHTQSSQVFIGGLDITTTAHPDTSGTFDVFSADRGSGLPLAIGGKLHPCVPFVVKNLSGSTSTTTMAFVTADPIPATSTLTAGSWLRAVRVA